MIKTKTAIIKFFFPFWPIKAFKTTKTIFLLAFLIALSILLNLINIKIVGGISLSFAWLPVIIIGWYFGPIIGLLMGAIIDTINWLIYGGIWFWLYAIQEPLIGLITGLLVSSFFAIKKRKHHFLINLIISQLITIGFLIFSIAIVFYFSKPEQNNLITSNLNNLLVKTNQIIKWLIISFLILFFTIIEAIIIYKLIKFKQQKKQDQFEDFLFICVLMIVITTLFSYLLGPISAIEYYKFINQTSNVPNLINYGYIYFLLPRVIKECFKTPVYIILLTLIICSLNPLLIKLKNNIYNSYIQY